MSAWATGLGLAAGIGGALLNKRSADKQHQFLTNQYHGNIALQKEFAKNAVQWKVEDAKKAGIHPLAALGANVGYGSPATVGAAPVADMSNMGQDISRAIAATATNVERKMLDITLDNAKIDNEMKRLELQSARRRLAGQVGPGIPDNVKTIPAEVTSHAKGKPAQEAGSITSVGFARQPDGRMSPVPSRDAKERIEDQLIPELVWAAQNYGGPMLGSQKNKPSKKLLPKGKGYIDWRWDYSSFSWEPIKHKHRGVKQRLKRLFGPSKKFHKKGY
jgi:hypothetical protein